MRTKLLLSALLLAGAIQANAQWQATNGPTTNDASCLAVNGTKIFSGTYNEGVYATTNGGAFWANTGWGNANISSLLATANGIYAGTIGDTVYKSTDNGVTWAPASNGFDNGFVTALAQKGTDLYAGSSAIFKSTNNGAGWTKLTTSPNYQIDAINVDGNNIYAGTHGDGIYLSSDDGATWTHFTNGLTNIDIYGVQHSGSNLVAGTTGGIVVSVDNGSHWTPVTSTIPSGTHFYSLILYGSTLIAGGNNGVYLSYDNGFTWTSYNAGLTDLSVYSLAISGTTLYTTTDTSGVFKVDISGVSTAVPNLATGNNLKVYPNPAHGVCTITADAGGFNAGEAILYNTLGAKVLSQAITAGAASAQLNVANLPKGTYWLQLSGNGNTGKSKLVVE